MNLSHAQQQKLLADNRKKEFAREDQIKRINQERILEANMDSEERIENKRFLRRLHQEATEREMDEGIRKVKALCCIHLVSNTCKLTYKAYFVHGRTGVTSVILQISMRTCELFWIGLCKYRCRRWKSIIRKPSFSR